MSYTNGTPFLNLPQTIGSDHRDWFDTNESFLDLDTKVKTLWDDSGSAASAIDALQELTATLQTDLTTLSGTVDTHTSALSTINEALVLINGTLATLNTSVATKFDSAGIADPYDATHGIYAVGDVVTYNGQRYVCSTAVTAAEPFDADKWTAKDIQSELNEINNDFSDHVITVTADGVKTSAALIAELMSALANVPLNGKRLNVVGATLPQSTSGRVGVKCESLFTTYGVAPSALQFSGIQTGTNLIRITAFTTNTNSSNVHGYLATLTDSTAIADISTIVPNNGMKLELHYKLLR